VATVRARSAASAARSACTGEDVGRPTVMGPLRVDVVE
jgi:hypothetical protein